MKRITVTIDESIYDKLPKHGKSGFVNLVLKQHFIKDTAEQLYQLTKKRLMSDKDMNDWIVATVREVV